MAVTDGDVIKVVLEWTCPSAVIAQNVFYWQLDDAVPDSPSNAQILTAVDGKVSAMMGDIQTALNDEYTAETCKVDKIAWVVDKWETTENIGEVDIDVTGGNINDAVPHGAAAVLTANTTRPQTRARKFFPGFGENLFEDSTLQGTIITALAALGVEWLQNRAVVGAAELVPVVVGQSGASSGLVYTLALVAINAFVGYQRRRKPGVGS